jgi:crotonobetainyl-CoA:carnitine CoA-transferase CaiB-like acyl-CoA transferase
LIHNSLQKSFDALGLSYEAVSGINPKIVYAAISGYGAAGAYKDFPSQDITIQGLSGFMSLNGYPDAPPVKTGVPVVDYVTGQNAVIGILAALREREKTGRGRQVGVSLLESALGMISVEAVRYLNTGVSTGRSGNRHSAIAPYNAYKALDGYIIIAAANDAMFERLVAALCFDKAGFETNGQRLDKIEALDGIINEKTQQRPVKELVGTLKNNKVSCEPINDIAQAFDSGAVGELDIIGAEGKLKYIKTPIN